jgi:single-stranded DNA-binding protein
MMKDMNKVILVGRLGADPVQRTTKRGVTVVNFPMATSRRVAAAVKEIAESDKAEDSDLSPDDAPDENRSMGESQESDANRDDEAGVEGAASVAITVEETQWHRIVVWGRQAESCSRYLKKGEKVLVEGSVRSRKYTAKDGSDRYAFEIQAENVHFLGGGARRSGELPANGALAS